MFMVVSIAHVIAGLPAMERTVQISTNVTYLHVMPTQPVLTLPGHTAVVASQDSLEMEVPVLTSTSVIITHAMQTQHA